MAAGSYERRFGGRDLMRYGSPFDKEMPALSIQCFESRHTACQGRCDPFEPQTVCECDCHAKESNNVN
jgi:hypothetical protein